MMAVANDIPEPKSGTNASIIREDKEKLKGDNGLSERFAGNCN